MTTREKALELREQGYTYTQIAQKIGVSRQRVQQICGKQVSYMFQHIKAEACIYPNLRAWMNENKVSRNEFVRRMGYTADALNITRLSRIMKGEQHPRKYFIDLMLKVTGMPYEEMFAVNEDGNNICD